MANYVGDSDKIVSSSYLFQQIQNLYTKIANLLGKKSDLGHTHNANEIVPIIKKSYTNIIATEGNFAKGAFYFGSIMPDSYYTPWRIKYRLHSDVDGQNNYSGEFEVELYGNQNSRLAYKIFNAHTSTSARTIYNHILYSATQTGINNDYGHLLGVGLKWTPNCTSSDYKRNFDIEILETENCSFKFFDEMDIFANIDGAISANYSGYSEYDAYNNGLRETGDDNSVDKLLSSNTKVYAGENGIFPNTLIMEDENGTWQSLVTTSSTGTTKTPNGVGFRPEKILFYNTSSTVTKGNLTPNWCLYESIPMRFDYSSNCGNKLTPYKPVYLKGTIIEEGNGLFYLEDDWYTQSLPITEDATFYIYLGEAYSSNSITLSTNHPIYVYSNGKIVKYTHFAFEAKKLKKPFFLEVGGVLNGGVQIDGQIDKSFVLNYEKIHLKDGDDGYFKIAELYFPTSIGEESASLLLNVNMCNYDTEETGGAMVQVNIINNEIFIPKIKWLNCEGIANSNLTFEIGMNKSDDDFYYLELFVSIPNYIIVNIDVLNNDFNGLEEGWFIFNNKPELFDSEHLLYNYENVYTTTYGTNNICANYAENANRATYLKNIRYIDGIGFNGTTNTSHFFIDRTGSSSIYRTISNDSQILFSNGTHIRVLFVNGYVGTGANCADIKFNIKNNRYLARLFHVPSSFSDGFNEGEQTSFVYNLPRMSVVDFVYYNGEFYPIGKYGSLWMTDFYDITLASGESIKYSYTFNYDFDYPLNYYIVRIVTDTPDIKASILYDGDTISLTNVSNSSISNHVYYKVFIDYN